MIKIVRINLKSKVQKFTQVMKGCVQQKKQLYYYKILKYDWFLLSVHYESKCINQSN